MKNPDPKKVLAAHIPRNYLIGWYRAALKGSDPKEARELADRWIEKNH